MEHLPKDAPLCSFAEFDEWVDGIWEAFYNEHEERAKEGDGILLKARAQQLLQLGKLMMKNVDG